MLEKRTEEIVGPRLSQAELRLKYIYTMAETFKTLGYTDMRAQASGYVNPPTFVGSHRSYAPDLFCRQVNSKQTPIVLHVVTARHFMDAEEFLARASLFASIHHVYPCEYHIACSSMNLKGEWLESRIRHRLENHGLTVNKIWTL